MQFLQRHTHAHSYARDLLTYVDGVDVFTLSVVLQRHAARDLHVHVAAADFVEAFRGCHDTAAASSNFRIAGVFFSLLGRFFRLVFELIGRDVHCLDFFFGLGFSFSLATVLLGLDRWL